MNIAKKAGSLSRKTGLKFEINITDILKNNTNIVKNILYNYTNKNINCVKNISVIHVSQVTNNSMRQLEYYYKDLIKPNNFKFQIPIDDKRAADIIILYQYQNHLYNIGIDTKKSKSYMTQLVRKSYQLLKNYITEEEYYHLFKYLKYENKKRTWINDNKNDIYKKHICNILEKIKHIWIKERFDDNSLYHNHLLLSSTNNSLDFINLHKLLNYIDFQFCSLKKTNFVFEDNNINLIGIKPHGTKKWTDLQLTIYKKAFYFKDICFSINF